MNEEEFEDWEDVFRKAIWKMAKHIVMMRKNNPLLLVRIASNQLSEEEVSE